MLKQAKYLLDSTNAFRRQSVYFKLKYKNSLFRLGRGKPTRRALPKYFDRVVLQTLLLLEISSLSEIFRKFTNSNHRLNYSLIRKREIIIVHRFFFVVKN